LSRADFRGADISGAIFTRANLEGASFAGAKGFEEAKGLDQSINLERPLR
jgi:uncharacterized protein YjbI with pentapeptide repeats